MRTTVTLDEGLVRELLELSAVKTKTAAVTLAVKEEIRRAKLRKLADMLGQIAVDEESLAAHSAADRQRSNVLDEVEGKRGG